MYHAARRERRAEVAGLLLSLGLTSFLTGVTEPVEFTFMFLAPVLYALHAIATGLAMVVMNLFGVRLGFSFSAGLFDYVLNFSHAQRPLLLLPIGAAYFGLYYAVFRATIVRLNLATPGREVDDTAAQPLAPATPDARARGFVAALGGAHNLTEVAACTTRLRLILVDNKAVDEALLKRLGARGIIRSSENGLQVVLGPIADQVAGEMRDALRSAPPAVPSPSPAPTPASATSASSSFASPASAPTATQSTVPDAPALLAALGGRDNVVDLETFAGRLLIRTAHPKSVDELRLARLGFRGIARSAADRIQVLVAGPVEAWAEPLRRLL
jgi:PTS system N-acetylglucosamine-specific IIC component